LGITDWGLGDWVPVKSRASVELTSTAYYFTDVSILAKAAKIFNKEEDYKKYSALAEKIQAAFNAKYLDTSTGIYASGIQTELSVPLFWGLVPDNLKSKVGVSLAKRIEADSIKLDVGLLGSKAILNALSENGYADLAYKLASSESFPSWGWWIVNGATTLYENWSFDASRELSLNHIMFGEISAWFYKALGGIKPDPENPGFKNILLHPHFVKGLDHFSAKHECLYGTIKSSWKRDGEKIIYTATIPANSYSTLILDVAKNQSVYLDGVKQIVTNNVYNQSIPSGTYTFLLQ
jgi:alpha-L-rhamnosidase